MAPPTKRTRKANSPKPSLVSSKKILRSTPRSPQANPSKRKSLASDQRDVFDWYEKYEYKDDAGDIFCPEWESRLTTWSTRFDEIDQENIDIHDRVSRHQQDPEKLELGLFFLAHSIAAFAFWNLLQACYKLDRCICGTSTPEEIAEWQNRRPFQYLFSIDIMSKWEAGLISFSTEVEQSTNTFKKDTNMFKKEAVAGRLHVMTEAFQGLEDALEILVSVFENRQASMRCSYWMLNHIREGLDNRYRAIGKHIRHHQQSDHKASK